MLERPLCAAMPPLDPTAPPLSRFEFWPGWAFYAPLWPWLGALMLRHGLGAPLAANPGLPASGLVGESKSAVFKALRGSEAATLARWIVEERRGKPALHACVIESSMEAAGIAYPVVAKPDLGCRGAGVRPVRNRRELIDYLAKFPLGRRLIIQQMVEAEGEAGVFYVRRPGEKHGRMISLTLKYFPHVVGDGASTVEQLILADPRAGRVPHLYLSRLTDRLREVPLAGEAIRLVFAGNHCRGAIFRNGNDLITDELTSRFDRIVDNIDGFHFGRFDIRFADWRAMLRGEGFTIVEFNGAGAESTHIWDSRTRLLEAWRDLARQYRLLFEIGAANRRLGHKPESLRQLWRRWRQEKNAVGSYPPTA
jgi:hypothetical protein